ncbi:MAG TPA: hypothetical protein VMB03_04010 [Bryobacteraceae bacterium]|nr:hypothetical protein [Bryobacteraceae bacterium]
MPSAPPPGELPTLQEGELPSAVHRIVHSSIFHGSEILRHLLCYLAERAAAVPPEAVKVREIAVAVFGRSDDFDSQSDSIVRVHTGRLRSKLAEYYLGEGAADPIVIAIPKGSYALTWSRRQPFPGPSVEAPALQPALPPHSPVQPAARFPRLRYVTPLATVVLVAAIAAWAAVARLQNGRSAESAALRWFWQPFVRNEQPPLLIFANLELVGSLDEGLREYDPHTDGSRPVIRTYTTTGEVMGVYDITRLLASLHQSVRAKHGSLLTWDEAKDSNLIFVGGPLADTPLRQAPTFTEFQFRNRRDGVPGQSGAVVNLHPQAGEEPVYYGPSTRPFDFDYAVIGLRASLNPGHWVLTLAGITEYGTEAAADFVTREESIKDLLAKLGVRDGSPVPAFEALLYTRVTGGVPIGQRLTLVHRPKL